MMNFLPVSFSCGQPDSFHVIKNAVIRSYPRYAWLWDCETRLEHGDEFLASFLDPLVLTWPIGLCLEVSGNGDPEKVVLLTYNFWPTKVSSSGI